MRQSHIGLALLRVCRKQACGSAFMHRSQTRELYSKAMAFIARRENVRSMDDLNTIYHDLVSPYGVESFACAEIYSPRGMPKAGVIFGNPHEGFLRDYRRTEAFRHDPMLREALISRQPFAWSDVMSRNDLSIEARAVMDLARSWSRFMGFVVPVHRLNGSIASIVHAGREMDLSQAVRGYLQLISVYFHDLGLALANLRENTDQNAVLLSPLQVCCLTGIARGMSLAELALREGLSEEEITTEIEAAQELLKAENPAQAVFMALRRNELTL